MPTHHLISSQPLIPSRIFVSSPLAKRRGVTQVKLAMDDSKPRLPLELVLEAIGWLVPDDPDTLLPGWDDRTKTLVSFTRVCRGTYLDATRYLRKYCMYIDSTRGLRALVLGLQAANNPSQLAVPFGEARLLRNVTSLYLGSIIDDRLGKGATAWLIYDLFSEVAGSLKRLVIDMSLRWLVGPESDSREPRKVLLAGLELLIGLEEFVTVRDDLDSLYYGHGHYVYMDNDLVWGMWPELRRLALYNPDAFLGFWHRVASIPKLESLVLTMPESLGIMGDCMKTEYFSKTDRPLKVLLVDWEPILDWENQATRRRWTTVDPGEKMRVVMHEVPHPEGGSAESACLEWVKSRAIRGATTGAVKESIWDWDGPPAYP
jgi:hypothetical protein